jgi:hypothetical protein
MVVTSEKPGGGAAYPDVVVGIAYKGSLSRPPIEPIETSRASPIEPGLVLGRPPIGPLDLPDAVTDDFIGDDPHPAGDPAEIPPLVGRRGLRQRRLEPVWRERGATEALAGRIEDRVGDGRGDRADRAFAGAGGGSSGWLISTMSTASGASVTSRIG